MTKEQEELLNEAKRRYPNGYKVKSLFETGNYEGTINWDKKYKHESPYFSGGKSLWIGTEETDGGKRILLHEYGKWAEIIDFPKPQFEVGKWYYANCEKLSKEKVYIIRYKSTSESCYLADNYIFVRDKSFHSTGGFTNLFEEVSLSEVQQYLPDDHIDLKKYLP